MKIYVETDRLILREILPEDEAGFFEMDSDPEVHKYLGNNPVTNIEQIREVIKMVRQQYIDNGIARWAMIEKSSGHFVGWSGLKLVKEMHNQHINYVDLGYRLLRKYWGHGYATESATAARDYAFQAMNLTELIGVTDSGNLGSQNVLTKIGFQFVEQYEEDGMVLNWYRLRSRRSFQSLRSV